MLRYLTDAGLPIYEGYGLNETCIVSKNHPGAHRMGSVGRVLRGKEVLFDEDGVILARSDHPVNQRYEFAEPGDSERMFLADGVVRTGDLGHVDEDGFLFILGRADDVIVLGQRQEGHRPADRGAHADESGDRGLCGVLPRADPLVAVVSPSADPADLEAIAEQRPAPTPRSAATNRFGRSWSPARGSVSPTACSLRSSSRNDRPFSPPSSRRS